MDIGAFNVVPELSVFNLFSLLCSTSVISTNLSSTLLICFSASCILLLAYSNEFFISVIVFCISSCFIFISCISLLSVSCKLFIFASSLFPVCYIIISIISLKFFPGGWETADHLALFLFFFLFPYLSYSSPSFHCYRFLVWCPFCRK